MSYSNDACYIGNRVSSDHKVKESLASAKEGSKLKMTAIGEVGLLLGFWALMEHTYFMYDYLAPYNV